MANEKKMTKKQMFEMIKANYNLSADEVAFIDHEIELLSRKNASGEKKPTATQVANQGIASAILEVMAENPNKMYTITDIIKSVPACAELTNQKVSAIVRGMVNDNSVERVEDKRKAYFRYSVQ